MGCENWNVQRLGCPPNLNTKTPVTKNTNNKFSHRTSIIRSIAIKNKNEMTQNKMTKGKELRNEVRKIQKKCHTFPNHFSVQPIPFTLSS
jgi:hypothetical protein